METCDFNVDQLNAHEDFIEQIDQLKDQDVSCFNNRLIIADPSMKRTAFQNLLTNNTRTRHCIRHSVMDAISFIADHQNVMAG